MRKILCPPVEEEDFFYFWFAQHIIESFASLFLDL